MPQIHRLPAIPLIASDPYFSVWMPADTLTQTDSCHWSGPAKPVRGVLVVDGVACRFLGAGPQPEATLSELTVSATQTRFVSEFGGVRLETRFVTPALPDDLDLLSMPVTLVTFSAVSTDGAQHQVQVQLHLSDRLCYDGEIRPAMAGETLCLDGRDLALCGQKVQKPLCHSGDHVTIDWGYLYLSADGKISLSIANRCAIAGISLTRLSPPQKNSCKAFHVSGPSSKKIFRRHSTETRPPAPWMKSFSVIQE